MFPATGHIGERLVRREQRAIENYYDPDRTGTPRKSRCWPSAEKSRRELSTPECGHGGASQCGRSELKDNVGGHSQHQNRYGIAVLPR
jgi:hypothetical protein